jgi:DNA-binding MarR family transcriptional regulator
MQEFTKEELTAVLFAALTRLRAELGSDVTAARILTMLTVARNPGLSQPELGQYIKDMSQQGLSRNVLDLSARTSSGTEGPDLVRADPDPAFRRRNILTPTPNTTKLLNALTADVNRVAKNRAKAN